MCDLMHQFQSLLYEAEWDDDVLGLAIVMQHATRHVCRTYTAYIHDLPLHDARVSSYSCHPNKYAVLSRVIYNGCASIKNVLNNVYQKYKAIIYLYIYICVYVCICIINIIYHINYDIQMHTVLSSIYTYRFILIMVNTCVIFHI